MSSFHAFRLAVCALAAAPFLQGLNQLDEPSYGENVYVNCEYRMAAIFPREPAMRDLTYMAGGRSIPARQFHAELGADSFSVIIAHVADGPAVDENLVEAVAVPLRQKGQIKFQFAESYDPGIPGRQLNISLGGGRQYRASVYMWDHRLYITEATGAEGDFNVLQFEQSISVINQEGTDLDKNGALPSRQYRCTK